MTSYSYRGQIIDPSLARNPKLAEQEREIFAACAGCIHGGNLCKDDYELSRLESVIDAFAADKLEAINNYHRIPHIPLMMQDEDWPMCCGDWCEFRGNPQDNSESVAVPTLHTFWSHGPRKWASDFELSPESLREVCVFHCLSCDRSYFIWQPT